MSRVYERKKKGPATQLFKNYLKKKKEKQLFKNYIAIKSG